MTNSDGDLGRRQRLLGLMPVDAVEEIIDPGEAVVRGRLTNRTRHTCSVIPVQVAAVIRRWFSRIPLGGIER